MNKKGRTTMDTAAKKSCHAKSAERLEYDFVSSSWAVRLRQKDVRKSFTRYATASLLEHDQFEDIHYSTPYQIR
jgi:hypothetical protein